MRFFNWSYKPFSASMFAITDAICRSPPVPGTYFTALRCGGRVLWPFPTGNRRELPPIEVCKGEAQNEFITKTSSAVPVYVDLAQHPTLKWEYFPGFAPLT